MNGSAVPPVPGTHPRESLRSLDELPGPRGLPLLGNALEIKPKDLHRLLGGWADQFGPLFVFSVATTRILTIVDADIIQHILRDRPDRFRRWRRMSSRCAGW